MNTIETNLKGYKAKLSESEKHSKALLKSLSSAYESLVKLAQLERDTKDVKKSIKEEQPKHELNDLYLDLAKVQTEQVNLPLLSIERHLSSIMTEIVKLNGPDSSNALDALPAIFLHSDRMAVFTGRDNQNDE